MALNIRNFFQEFFDRVKNGARIEPDNRKKIQALREILEDSQKSAQEKLVTLNDPVVYEPFSVLLSEASQDQLKQKAPLPDTRGFFERLVGRQSSAAAAQDQQFSIIPTGDVSLEEEFNETVQFLKKLEGQWEEEKKKKQKKVAPTIAKVTFPGSAPAVKDFVNGLQKASGNTLKLLGDVKQDTPNKTQAEFTVFDADTKDTGRKVNVTHTVQHNGSNSTATLEVSGGWDDVIEAMVCALDQANPGSQKFSFNLTSVTLESSIQNVALDQKKKDEFYKALKDACESRFSGRCVFTDPSPQVQVKASMTGQSQPQQAAAVAAANPAVAAANPAVAAANPAVAAANPAVAAANPAVAAANPAAAAVAASVSSSDDDASPPAAHVAGVVDDTAGLPELQNTGPRPLPTAPPASLVAGGGRHRRTDSYTDEQGLPLPPAAGRGDRNKGGVVLRDNPSYNGVAASTAQGAGQHLYEPADAPEFVAQTPRRPCWTGLTSGTGSDDADDDAAAAAAFLPPIRQK